MTCLLLSKGLKIHASPPEGRKHQVLLGRTLKAKLDSWRSMRFNDVPNMRVGNVNSQQVSCIKMTCGEVRVQCIIIQMDLPTRSLESLDFFVPKIYMRHLLLFYYECL